MAIKDEGKRQAWVKETAEGRLSVKDLSDRLETSERQAWRLLKRYRKEGAKGLLHGLEGKPSNHRHPASFKETVMDLIRNKYWDFGPTLAAEHLAEEERIVIHRDTLCRWMRAEKLLTKVRKRSPHRKKRIRKPRFGQMLQIDGSPHHWFGLDHPKACLLNLIDDATSKNLCFFDHEETLKGACLLLWQWCQKYGIPQSIYADRRNAYISQDLTESNGLFGQMCRRLDIATIPAFSPQAKGRVERSNQTHQDRLIKKMRLVGVTTIDTANAFLKTYLPNHNRRFSKPPEEQIDVHRKLPKHAKLEDFCFFESERKVQNDWTIKYKNKLLQIQRRNYCPAKSTVHVKETLDGTLQIFFKNQKLSFNVL
jgi:Transposase and inactivated derivatives